MNQALEIHGPDAVERISRVDIDIQISTAKKYPRSEKECGNKMVALATVNDDVAAECYYHLERDGKAIEGPSIRMAEIALSKWGNCRVAANVVEIGREFVVAEGVGWDLENNVGVKTQCRRRLTRRDGSRYSDDMIAVTSNAACSIAMREAIFKLVPRALVTRAYEAAKRIAVGDKSKLPQRIDKMFERYKTIGVTEPMILEFLKKPGRNEISQGDIERLIGTYTSLMDGDSTVGETFVSRVVEQKAPEPAPAAETAPAAPTEPAASPAPDAHPPRRGRPPKDKGEKTWRERYSSKALAAYKGLGADKVAAIRDEVEAAFGTFDDWDEDAYAAAYTKLEEAMKK